MSDRERQEALGEVFALLAMNPSVEVKRIASRIFRELRANGYSCNADEALQALGLVRYDTAEAEKWGTSGAVYGPVDPVVEPFPPVRGGLGSGGWRWAGPMRYGMHRCEAKFVGFRGCTRKDNTTVYLPDPNGAAGARPCPVILCHGHAEEYRAVHPEAVIIEGRWETESRRP